MASKIRIALLACVIIIFAGCARPKALEYRDIHNFRVQKADLSTVILVMDIELYNPNNYSLSLKNGDLDAFINDRALGRAIIDETTLVPAGNSFLLPVRIEVTLASVFQNALDALVSKAVQVRLDGTVRAGKGGIFISIPVHYSGQQQIHL